MRAMLEFYWMSMKTEMLSQFQYRASNYFYMIGMIVEPVIYLVVWSTIARNSPDGTVQGIAPGEFAAYYIVWTLVRNMNIVFTPYGWEHRIQRGVLSGLLLRPIHPIHYDLAAFAGWKVVVIILWLPLAAFLTLVFRPTLNPTLMEVGAFFLAIWGAYLIRSMFQSVLGMITFWTTRVAALFELYFAAELLLSGRLVPMTLMPEWVQRVASYLPFQWTFFFPIQSLVGDLTPQQLLMGLATQAFWVLVGALILNVSWRYAIRHYSAVGN